MRVLITGAAGFVGSAVTRQLLAEGAEVHALLRPDADPWRIADILPSLRVMRAILQAGPEARREISAIVRASKPDACLHLAWHAVPGEYLESPRNLDMVAASLELALALAETGCSRLLVTGTCFEYDTAPGRLNERSTIAPRSLYARSKAGLFPVLERYSELAGISFVWPRLFYLYGPREDERRLVASVISKLIRGEVAQTTAGTQLRDYLHVADVAAALVALARSDFQGAVNVGSGQPVMVCEIVEQIGILLDRPDLIRVGALSTPAGEPEALYADNSLLRASVDWRPRYDLDSGLRHTIDWWTSRLGAASAARQPGLVTS